jgi:hypothetical protein
LDLIRQLVNRSYGVRHLLIAPGDRKRIGYQDRT